MAALLVAQLAEGVITLNEQIKTTEQLVEDRFHRHELAEVIRSMPGIGAILGAEFLAATDGDMSVFASADHLAAYAGLAPAPPLQPRPEPGLLHIGAGQHPTQPRLPALL